MILYSIVDVRPQFDIYGTVRNSTLMATKDKRYELRMTPRHLTALQQLAYLSRQSRPEVLHKLIEREARRKGVWPK